LLELPVLALTSRHVGGAIMAPSGGKEDELMAVLHAERKSAPVEAYRGHGPQEEEGPDLEAWRERVDVLRRESANAYAGFLDSLFCYYRESMRAPAPEPSGGKEWR
jgi:hypothetical protein